MASFGDVIAVSARITSVDSNEPSVQTRSNEPSAHTKSSEQTSFENDLVKHLFDGIHFDGTEQVTFKNDHYTLVQSSLLSTELYSQFGAQLDIGEVDRNIKQLIADKQGWLESREESVFEIHENSVAADLEEVVDLVISSLSSNIIGVVKKLLSNISEILTHNKSFARVSKIDAQIYERQSDNNIVVIHTRFTATMKKRKINIIFLKTGTKKIKMRFNMRKIGLNKAYVDKIDPEYFSQNPKSKFAMDKKHNNSSVN